MDNAHQGIVFYDLSHIQKGKIVKAQKLSLEMTGNVYRCRGDRASVVFDFVDDARRAFGIKHVDQVVSTLIPMSIKELLTKSKLLSLFAF